MNNLDIKVLASPMAPPTSSEPIEGQRTNARGQKLFTVTYRASGQQRAVLFHHHGYGEHVGRMRHCKSSILSLISHRSMCACIVVHAC